MENWNKKLYTAAVDGDIETLKLCLQNGADIDYQDDLGQTALMSAARYGHLEICRLLIDRGCKIDITNELGVTALICAAERGHLEICGLLIDTGCKIDITDVYGQTALMLAAGFGHLEICSLLIDTGCKIDITNEDGWTALMIAASREHLEICRLLTDRGCKIDITDVGGQTALMKAVRYGHLEICRLLIDTGCKIDITSRDGETALHYAAREGYLQITRCLVEQGRANPLIKTHEGETPYDLAAGEKQGQYEEVMKYLQEQHQVDPYLLVDLIPTEINLMADKRSVALYLNLLESGFEQKREIRLVIVGKKGAGKTSFIKRLFNKEKKVDGQKSFTEDTEDETGTNGIEIHRVKCRANSNDGTWNILDGNSEETELYGRILKPLEEKLEKEARGTSRTKTAATTTGVSESTNSEKKLKYKVDSLVVPSDAIQTQVELQEAKQVRFQVDNKSEKANVSQIKPPIISTPYHDHKHIADELTAMLQFKVDLHDREEYATLLFWDFAGDEEFYHTHQTFLSPDAIYVVVTNLSEVNDKNSHDMFELWMNSIHCYCTLEREENKSTSTTNEMKYAPPVILVGSHKDKVRPTEEKKIETICEEKLQKFLDGVSLYARSQIQQILYISNTTDNDDVFRDIRQTILELASRMKTWKTNYPLKFIQLEKKIQEKKKNLHIPIITFGDIEVISKDISKPLQKKELELFLEYQHATRALIYFEDLPDFIILDTQWLSHIFKCIVTAKKYQSKFLKCKMTPELNDLHFKGILQKTLLGEIFNDTTNVLHQHVGHKDDILKVMEKFDIIIPATEDKPFYFVPCMVKRKPKGDIYDMINATTDKCKRSTWLCFKFEFLPPNLINHLIASLISYGVAKVDVPQQTKPQFGLFKDTVVFQLDNTQSNKLLVLTGSNVIKIQVIDFRDNNEKTPINYLAIVKCVTDKLENIVKLRFKMSNVKFEKKWECGRIKPESVTEYHDFSKEDTEYCCEICKPRHFFKNEWAMSHRSEAAPEFIHYTGNTSPQQAVDITEPICPDSKLDFSDMLDQMMTKLVISVDDRGTIEQNTDQENTMLDIVIKRGEPNKSVCIDILMQNSGYKDLAQKLKSDSSSSVPPPTKTELQDVPDYKIRLQKNYLEIIKTLTHDQ